jgi:hypothetical protein
VIVAKVDVVEWVRPLSSQSNPPRNGEVAQSDGGVDHYLRAPAIQVFPSVATARPLRQPPAATSPFRGGICLLRV